MELHSEKYRFLIGLLLILGLIAGCSPESVTTSTAGTIGGGGGTPSSTPSAIQVTSSFTSMFPSDTSNITAYVVNNIGQPVTGATVTFSLDSGLKGQLTSATAVTDTNGRAIVVFTAGATTTVAVITASIGSVSGNTSVTITGGTGGTVTVVASPTSIPVGSNSSITATVRDGGGTAVPSATVNFSLNNTSANFSGAATTTATTNSSGVVTVTLTGATAGSVTVTASSLGVNGTANVTVTAIVLTDTITAAAAPTSILTSGTSTITANLRNSINVPIVGATVTFTMNNPAAADLVDSLGLAASSAVTDASGNAVIYLRAKTTPATVLVTATYGTVSSTTSVSITVPPPARVDIQTSPPSILVLGTTTIIATVFSDAAGTTPVPDGTAVTFFLSDGSFGSLSTTSSSTANSNGTATTTFIAANKAGSVDVTAVAGGISRTTSIIIAPAATGSIQFVSASPQIVGIQGSGKTETSIVTFRVIDINGNPVADGTAVTFVMSGPGGGAYITGSVAAPTATSSTVNGYAYVTLHSGTVAGTVTIIASTFVNSGAQTTLTAAIDPSVTTIPVVTTSGFTSPGKIRIDNELIDFTGITAISFTGCTRGAVQTTPLNHLSGAGVYRQSTISTSATQISIGGGVPSAGHWNLATSTFNIAGLKTSGLTANISAFIADRFGNYNILQGTVLNYYPEAGAIISSTVTDASGLSTASIRTQYPDPAEVKNAVNTPTADGDFGDFAPYFGATNEPWYTMLGTTYNPRDGWVTVLATTMGEEKFLDENGNGMFTRSYADSTSPCPAGYSCECDGGVTDAYSSTISPTTVVRTCNNRSEAFVDIGEPFYDINDNGKRDNGATPGKPFETFIDANGSGTYNGPNGLWDGPDCKATNSACQTSKMIWKDIRLVFTGDYYFWPLPDTNNCYNTVAQNAACSALYAAGSSFATAPATIVKGSSGFFCVRIGDRNLNRLPGGTVLVASAAPSKSVTPGSVTLLDGLSTGPTNFCFTVSVDTTTTDNATVVSAGVQNDPLATITVPLTNPPLAIQTAVLPNGTVGVGYTASIAVTGGTTPYAWALTAGSLPTGLTLDPSTGVISGNPTVANTFGPFTIQVTDSAATVRTRNFTITIN